MRMRTTLVSLVSAATVLVVVESLSVRPPFRSLQAPAETIKNYEVHVPTWKNRVESVDGQHPERIEIGISNHVLHLELNRGLVPAHFSSRHYDNNGNEVVKKGHVNCFYHGKVKNHPNWHVAMSMCHGLQGSFGELGNKNRYYHIEPMDSTESKLLQPHALYLASEYSEINGTCGVSTHDSSSPNDYLSSISDQIHIDRNKVRRQVNGFNIVEWAIVNDFAQYQSNQMNLSATVLRDLEIANFVDSLYRTLNVRVVVVHVTTWTTGDRISYPSDNAPRMLLDNFLEYAPQITVEQDSIMLITGVDLLGDTVGIAFVGTMCQGFSSIGLTQDGLRGLAAVGSTAAHELGHIFSMEHDDNRGCTCTDNSGICIMAAVSRAPSPVEWSSCSRSDIANGFRNDNLDRCLGNAPRITVGDPVCGNGIREESEICDCGTPQECVDPCCNATSCMLVNGAQCSEGACCSESCRFYPIGTTCRVATQECDILEYCLGDSSDCPRDVHLQDGHMCNSGNDFCFSGVCQILDNKCQRFFGSSNSPECYSILNVAGEGSGNCGSNRGRFIPCTPENAQCGQLQCMEGDFTRGGVSESLTIFRSTRGSLTCRSFTTEANSDTVSPGLVPEGTRCGNQRLCVSQSCTEISDLNYLQPCPIGQNNMTCAGTGVCSNLNQCACNVGFTGATCEQIVSIPGSSENSSNAGVIAGSIVGVILGLILITGIVVGVVFLIRCYKQHKSSTTRVPKTNTTGKEIYTKHTGSQENLLDPTPVHVIRPSTTPKTFYQPPSLIKAPSHNHKEDQELQDNPAHQRTPDNQAAPPRQGPPFSKITRGAPPSRSVPPPPNRNQPPPPPNRSQPPPPPNRSKPPPPNRSKPPPPNRTQPPPPPVKAVPAAPKPGKIQRQWPPPSEEENSKKPLPLPKKPMAPPKR